MQLYKNDIIKLINDNSLVIRPLLDKSEQIKEISIEFRLGYDFLVLINGRKPQNHNLNSVKTDLFSSHFFETRRKIGESFIFNPGQTVLATSLEYLKLPVEIFALLSIKNSYGQLELKEVSSIILPGHCGCICMEITNSNKKPLSLTIGDCIFQAKFIKHNLDTEDMNKQRKNNCHVRPDINKLNYDENLVQKLLEIGKNFN
jgi:dCTP deaminase